MKKLIWWSLFHPITLAALTFERRVNALFEIQGFVRNLHDYYGERPLLEDTWHHYPMTSRGLQRLASHMVEKDRFVIGVIGSSVAAGHDNCNYDSYERQLERTLTPLFARYGKTVEVRNAGQGGGCGDSYQNQIWCMRAMIGNDVDAVHYSWTYFEHGDDILAWHETFVRWSLLLESAPVPMILNTGVGPHEGADDRLYSAYQSFGYNAVYLQRGLAKHLGYAKRWGAVGDGLHNKTRDGGDGVVFRNWHPGPLGFQVVADAFALVYAQALRMAMTSNDLPPIKLLSQADLPNPIACDPQWCGSEEPPSCLALEEPHFGQSRLLVVTAETDDLFPYPGLNGPSWEWYKPPPSRLIPRADRNRPECQHSDYCSGYKTPSTSGWITIRLPRMERGMVWVCCANGKHCGGSMASLHYILDGEELDTHQMTPMFGKCLQIQNGFPAQMADTSGHMYLAMQSNEVALRLSHVITL